MKCCAVVFDVDGVLVDSYGAHLEAWQRLAAHLGLTMSEREFASMFGRRNREIIRRHWGRHVPDGRVEEYGDWKEVQYREILQADFPAMDGARELVDTLKAAGFALAIGSSGPPENIRLALEGLGRARLFDAIVSGIEVRVGKPDPEVFLKAAEKLGAEPRCCAVVEDSTAGVQAAKAAGMAAVALVGTAPREALEAAGAVLVVESLRELGPGPIAELIEKRRG